MKSLAHKPPLVVVVWLVLLALNPRHSSVLAALAVGDFLSLFDS